MERDQHPEGEQEERGPLEAALRDDMQDALRKVPRIDAAFESGKDVSITLTAEEIGHLDSHIVWMLYRHLLTLAAEVDHLPVDLDG